MSELKKYEVLGNLKHDGKKYKPAAKGKKPGDDNIVEMTPDDAAELIKLGVLSEMEGQESDEERLMAYLRDAYAKTPNNSPNLKDIKADLGLELSGSERDAAWEKVKAEASTE
ncbi:hypothetical protein RYZ26_15330 [Terasakiella sp. A23]|uniref:hypothetical protein n=1 Tax=Terasakiella sp. FCG-A23 TaxID=3080561 RepID=UPI002953C994|nr:hypothetical protein [Terasakiella sp. A23]MDV7340977.1 hypothetical protein [Terasakiella sp. A23]